MDIDYAPTGREFVSGSYDRTVRIFPVNTGKSREVYHGQRMQKSKFIILFKDLIKYFKFLRIFAVCYSLDNEYVISGSEDMNIRLWKSNASKPLGTVISFKKNNNFIFFWVDFKKRGNKF